MLIINADDWGMDTATTDRILNCFRNGRITSATAMMFMVDSERSAELALLHRLPIGFHLNFTQPFSHHCVPSKLKNYHNTLVKYFTKIRYARIIYNPLIWRQIDYCFKAQYAEFERLYENSPTHIDGHHHIHLCANLMFSTIIPRGMKIRRNVPFSKKEKNFVNWWWRSLIDKIIRDRFITTDFFLGLYGNVSESDVLAKLNMVNNYNVEFMVHPGLPEEYNLILSDRYARIIQGVAKGSYEVI